MITQTIRSYSVLHSCGRPLPFSRFDRYHSSTSSISPSNSSSSSSVDFNAKKYFVRRSLLYIPGSSTKMLNKAHTLNADSVCMDLEDAVALNKKSEARTNIFRVLNEISVSDFGRTERQVRINPCGSGFEHDDVDKLLSSPVLPDTFVLPKVESADHIAWLDDKISRQGERAKHVQIIGMIESGVGLSQLSRVIDCRLPSHRRVSALIFGGDDFAASIGAERTASSHELMYARQKIIVHAKINQLQAIDVVHISLDKTHYAEDEAQGEGESRLTSVFARECKLGQEMGFTGKQVIHPMQLGLVHSIFGVSSSRLEWAIKVVKANNDMQNQGKGAFNLDGQMIDMPTVKQAEQVLIKARCCGLTF